MDTEPRTDDMDQRIREGLRLLGIDLSEMQPPLPLILVETSKSLTDTPDESEKKIVISLSSNSQ